MTTPTASPNQEKKHRRYFDYLLEIKEKTKTPQTRSFAWFSITLFTISFFVIVAIRPTLLTIANLTKEIKDKKELNKEMTEKIKSIVAAQQAYANNIDALPLLNEALPERSEFPKLAYFLEQSALSSGVTLKSISFGKIDEEKKEGDIANILSFNLAVEGEYPKLKNFLLDLEQSRRIAKIDTVSFGIIKKEGTNNLSLTLSGIVFYQEKK